MKTTFILIILLPLINIEDCCCQTIFQYCSITDSSYVVFKSGSDSCYLGVDFFFNKNWQDTTDGYLTMSFGKYRFEDAIYLRSIDQQIHFFIEKYTSDSLLYYTKYNCKSGHFIYIVLEYDQIVYAEEGVLQVLNCNAFIPGRKSERWKIQHKDGTEDFIDTNPIYKLIRAKAYKVIGDKVDIYDIDSPFLKEYNEPFPCVNHTQQISTGNE